MTLEESPLPTPALSSEQANTSGPQQPNRSGPNFEKGPRRRRAASLAFIQSKLRRLNRGSSKRKVPSSVDAKGPLGLNLLHEPSEPRIDFIFVRALRIHPRRPRCRELVPWGSNWQS